MRKNAKTQKRKSLTVCLWSPKLIAELSDFALIRNACPLKQTLLKQNHCAIGVTR
jgi:hypothetical protein